MKKSQGKQKRKSKPSTLQQGLRGLGGRIKGVWMKDHNGRIKKVETLTEYPETVAMFLLKAHKSKVYREPKTEFGMTQTAPDGTVTEFAVHVSKDELP